MQCNPVVRSHACLEFRSSRGSRAGAVVRLLAFHQCGPGLIPGFYAICGLSLSVLYSAPSARLSEQGVPSSILGDFNISFHFPLIRVAKALNICETEHWQREGGKRCTVGFHWYQFCNWRNSPTLNKLTLLFTSTFWPLVEFVPGSPWFNFSANTCK